MEHVNNHLSRVQKDTHVGLEGSTHAQGLSFLRQLMSLLIVSVLMGTMAVAQPQQANADNQSDLAWLSTSPLTAIQLDQMLDETTGVALQVSGGTPPYAVSVVTGSLPPGITISGTTLVGTATNSGVNSFTLRVTDDAEATTDRQFELSVVRGKRPVKLETVTDSPAERVVLGDLASRTQAKNTSTKSSTIPTPLTSGWVTIEGATAPYTMRGVDARTGEPYSFGTNFNYATTRPAWRKEGHEAASLSRQSYSRSDTTYSGRAARLLSSTLTCPNTNATFTSFCSAFGPEVWTEPFVADQGESLSFAWAAQGGGDDYESYAFLVKVEGADTPLSTAGADVNAHTLLAYGRGGTQPWTTASGEIPADGTYRFRFVNGSYDRTGFFGLGARMYVDQIVTLGATQTITFLPVPPQTTASGAGNQNVINMAEYVSVSSGLTPELTVSGQCTVSGLLVSLTNSGNCTVTANQPGSNLFVPAASVTQSFGITLKTAQAAVSATLSASSGVYGDEIEVTPSGGSGDGAFTVSLSAADSCSLREENGRWFITITQGSGNCAAVATKAGDTTFAQRSSTPITLAVAPRPLTVTGTTAVSRPYNGSTSVTVQAGTLEGVLAGDSVALLSNTTVGTAAAATVGTHSVTTAFMLTGPQALNYVVTQPAVTVMIGQAEARMWFNRGLVQYVDSDGNGVGLPQVAADPVGLTGIVADWDDGQPPTRPGRYRVTLTLTNSQYIATPVTTYVTVLPAPQQPANGPVAAIGPVAKPDDDGIPTFVALPPSHAVAMVDNLPVNVTVQSLTGGGTSLLPTRLRVEHSTGLQITLIGREKSGGDELPLADGVNLLLKRGGTADISGAGLKVGTHAEVWMFSEPTLLGLASIDQNGNFDEEFEIPDDVAPGEHVIQLNGIAPNGELQSTSIGVLVEAEPASSDSQPVRGPDGRLLFAPVNGPQTVIGGQFHTATIKPAPRGSGAFGATSLTGVSIVPRDPSLVPFAIHLAPQTSRRVARTGGGGVIDGRLAIKRSEGITTRVEGFAPFSVVQLWLFSEPRLLGRFVTDGNGLLNLSFADVPDDIVACRHTIHVAGTLTNGQRIGASVGIWVLADNAPFPDVEPLSTHGPAITCLKDLGVIQGFTDGDFHETGTLTRGHAATILAGLFHLPAADAQALTTFSDTAESPHADAIASLQAAGAVSGFNDGSFRPNMAVTRGQVTQMLSALLPDEADTARDDGADTSVMFSDISGRSDARAINQLAATGILHGFADGGFKPDAPITRGQFASLVVHARYHQDVK